MKHQYFGDENDYRKYGILRVLNDGGRIRLGVFWMLTEPDGSNDGMKVSYLHKPDRWRPFDPELFDLLRKRVFVNRRSVLELEKAKLLPGARYCSEMLSDDPKQRQRLFADMLSSFADRDLIFFDPDKGVEVSSIPYGRKGASGYIYEHELAEAYESGKSLLIFQHRRRQRWDQLVESVSDVIEAATGTRSIFTIETSAVAYFLIPRRGTKHEWKSRLSVLPKGWGLTVT